MSAPDRRAAGERVARALARDARTDRDTLVDVIAARLDAPMAALGIIFLLLVVAETAIRPEGALAGWFAVASWALWVVFVAEFVVRFVVARSKRTFLRRNWWQIVVLAVPPLRLLRFLRAFRGARAARVLSSAVRATRSSRQRFTGRLGWLLAVTAIVILAGSQLLFDAEGARSYADVLYGTAHLVLTGEPIGARSTLGRMLELALAAYSVVVFATLAGTIGAFLLERSREHAARDDVERARNQGSAA